MGGVQQKFQHKLLVQDAVSGKMAQRALCILIRFLQGYKPCQFHHKISFPFLNWGMVSAYCSVFVPLYCNDHLWSKSYKICLKWNTRFLCMIFYLDHYFISLL